MKKVFALFTVLLFLSGDVSALSNEAYNELIRKLRPLGMKLGEGNNTVFAFVDPLCPNSRNYISALFESKKLQQLSTYHLYLYGMKKYASQELIHFIYDTPDPLTTMHAIMSGSYEPDLTEYKASVQARERAGKIRRLADRFGARRRPYILFYKSGSGYCRVSEGSAPCLEEPVK